MITIQIAKKNEQDRENHKDCDAEFILSLSALGGFTSGGMSRDQIKKLILHLNRLLTMPIKMSVSAVMTLDEYKVMQDR